MNAYRQRVASGLRAAASKSASQPGSTLSPSVIVQRVPSRLSRPASAVTVPLAARPPRAKNGGALPGRQSKVR